MTKGHNVKKTERPCPEANTVRKDSKKDSKGFQACSNELRQCHQDLLIYEFQ